MAGGAGTRLWPVSRERRPKHVYPLIDKETLLQKTWKRLARTFSADHIFVATSKALPTKIRIEIPKLPGSNLVVEPLRRGTAAALGLTLLKLLKRDPQATFVYVNADNFVRDEKEFLRMLGVANRAIAAKPKQVVLIGVNPTYPETGYGYIKMGSQVTKFGKDRVFKVEAFVEKPELKAAKRFLRSWEYLWNPTLIVARADHFLSLYKDHLPRMWKSLAMIQSALGRKDEERTISREFSKMQTETIDYGILEREKNMLVVPGNFGWMDVGHWKVVHEILAKKPTQTVCKGGKCIALDSHGNLIYSLTGKLVALAGVSNMMIVETEDALLVCPKDRAQDVKKLVEQLEKKGMRGYL